MQYFKEIFYLMYIFQSHYHWKYVAIQWLCGYNCSNNPKCTLMLLQRKEYNIGENLYKQTKTNISLGFWKRKLCWYKSIIMLMVLLVRKQMQLFINTYKLLSSVLHTFIKQTTISKILASSFESSGRKSSNLLKQKNNTRRLFFLFLHQWRV